MPRHYQLTLLAVYFVYILCLLPGVFHFEKIPHFSDPAKFVLC